MVQYSIPINKSIMMGQISVYRNNKKLLSVHILRISYLNEVFIIRRCSIIHGYER